MSESQSKLNKIIAYLKQNGTSTAADIARNVDKRNLMTREVGKLCQMHPELFDVDSSRYINTITLREGVESA